MHCCLVCEKRVHFLWVFIFLHAVFNRQILNAGYIFHGCIFGVNLNQEVILRYGFVWRKWREWNEQIFGMRFENSWLTWAWMKHRFFMTDLTRFIFMIFVWLSTVVEEDLSLVLPIWLQYSSFHGSSSYWLG